MKLKNLIKNLETVKIIGDLDVDITSVKINSNEVVKNSIFICLSGKDYDGHNFAKEVEKYGAKAIICEKKVDTNLCQIIVKDSRKALSIVSSEFYSNAHKKMKIVGVTGTNGKTTTTHLITSILTNNGIKCGLIGTLGVFYSGKYVEANLTTPDPVFLHKIFSDMYKSGVEVVVMEVSAHAIFLKKVYGIDFEVAVFTNCTQDHLDFFGDMQNYVDTKKEFFLNHNCKYVVTNADDDVGRELSEQVKGVITYGIKNPCDVFAIDINEKLSGSSFVLNLFDNVYNVKLNLIGEHNVYNCLGASVASALLGVKTDNVAQGIENLKGVDGRLELILDGDFAVYVDYAHTPDGLEKTLKCLKRITKGRLICVFGCGGNRDAVKREIMGEVSAKNADFTVITSDNPRFEEPMEIIWQIEKGVLRHSKNYVIVEDRTEAVKYALAFAKKGDVVLIAGKGSEKYQEVFGIKRFYNDKDTVEEILRG